MQYGFWEVYGHFPFLHEFDGKHFYKVHIFLCLPQKRQVCILCYIDITCGKQNIGDSLGAC